MKYTLGGEQDYEGVENLMGQKWNGFEIPLFNRETVADILNDEGIEFEFCDDKLKVFVNPADRSDVHIYTSTPDGYYALGAFSWTWQQA